MKPEEKKYSTENEIKNESCVENNADLCSCATPEETDKKSTISPENFIDSLNSISPDDIAPEKNKKNRKKKNKSKLLRISLLVICIIIFCVSLYMISYEVISGIVANNIYSSIEEDFFDGIDLENTESVKTLTPDLVLSETPMYGEERSEYNSDSFNIIDAKSSLFLSTSEKLKQYKKENEDTYAWIRVDGTNISYIVVKGTDNKYYLSHTYTKKYNSLGTVFADYHCQENILNNPNVVLYGHNVTYKGQMFADLTKFLNKSFFMENRYITLYTLEGILKYEIFSIHEASHTYYYFQTVFPTEKSYLDWAYQMKENSIHELDKEITFSNTDRILTLSTCTNGRSTRRYAVHAKLVSVER